MAVRVRTMSALACLCVVAGMLAACGGDDDDSTAAVVSNSPGRLFSGTYGVTITDPERPTDTTEATWVVQSSCTGPDDGCVAMATPTVANPDPDSPPRTEAVQFVYEKGTWSRAVVPADRSCTPPGMSAPVVEPWVALDTTTFSATDTESMLPVTTLTGNITSIQGGSCSSVTKKSITLTRKGILPPGADRPATFAFPKAVTSPAAGFRGTYEQRTTVVSWNPPTLISNPTVQVTAFTATSTCTRDGEHCVVVMLDKPAKPGQTVAVFADGGFDQTATLPERPCPGQPARYSPTLGSRTAIPDGATSPIATLTNESTLTWTGACAGTVKFESTITRTGD